MPSATHGFCYQTEPKNRGYRGYHTPWPMKSIGPGALTTKDDPTLQQGFQLAEVTNNAGSVGGMVVSR